VLGLVDVAYILVALPTVEFVTREAHVVYTIGHFAALGLASGVVSRIGPRWSRNRRLAAAGAFAVAVGAFALYPELHGPARKLAVRLGGGETAAAVALLLVFASAVPAALAAGQRLSRSRLRWLSLAIGVAVGIHNQLIYRFDNPGVHLFYAWCAAATIAASIRPALPDFGRLRDRTRRLARLLAAVILLAIVFTVVVVPGNLVLVDMSRASGSVLFPYWSRAHARIGAPQMQAVDGLGPWFVDRSSLPDRPRTLPAMLADDPIVLLIGIDAARADIFESPRAKEAFPNLHVLRERSIEFSRARAPGAATTYTMPMMFSGKYFSQLYWTRKTHAGTSDLWPHEDDSVRFPQLLSEAGVTTYTASPTFWLTNEFGMARGFEEQEIVAKGESIAPRGASHWSAAEHVVDHLIARLDRGPSRFFGFAHFLEPHAPYDAHGGGGPPIVRYLAEIAHVDAQIGRLLDALRERGLESRTTVILISDHGEAFGDHGAILHATTLYEEQLRIPMWVSLPDGKHRIVDTPVTLMDVGPTVLDLFGLPTPATFMGESLVPLLRGDDVALSRPIVAEGRRMRAMVFADEIKVIRSLDKGTVEVYVLSEDPGELKNLYAGHGSEYDEQVATLDAFFAVHTLRREGYEVPLRK
jgi:arylsulfatase A-like enzyme